MTGLIQGKDAVLSLFKNDWTPFLCATDITVTLTADTVATRTVGDGQWKKNAYLNSSYTVSLSGLLKYNDDTTWTGWDMIDNWLNYTDVLFRIAFTDDEGNIRSVEGYALVTSSTLGISAGALVKNDFDMTGNGQLKVYDGLIACDAVVTSVSTTEDAAGVHVSYTITGSPFKVKFRLNNQGRYYTSVSTTGFLLTDLYIGIYSIEIIPICQNGYEGEGLSYSFQVNSNQNCPSGVTSLTFGTSTVTILGFPVKVTAVNVVVSGAVTGLRYVLDGGAPVYTPYKPQLTFPTLDAGGHDITVTPICASSVAGTPASLHFDIGTQPAQSVINYQLTTPVASQNKLQIFVNDVLYASVEATGVNVGSITAPTGSTVRVNLAANQPGKTAALQVQEVSTVIDSQSAATVVTLVSTFTPNGDPYTINATIS